METLLTALTWAALFAIPAFVQSANAAPPSDLPAGAGQDGSFQGYPLSDWYRQDRW